MGCRLAGRFGLVGIGSTPCGGPPGGPCGGPPPPSPPLSPPSSPPLSPPSSPPLSPPSSPPPGGPPPPWNSFHSDGCGSPPSLAHLNALLKLIVSLVLTSELV